MNELPLKNKKIWITGASKGIGAAITRKLVDSGATLILSSSSIETIKDLKEELPKNSKIFFMPFDLRSVEKIVATHERIISTLGPVDIMINNAGVGKFRNFNKLTSDDMENMMDINFKAIFHLIQQVLPDMLSQKSGVIINMLSIVVHRAFTRSSLYAASKAAVLAMDRSLREEVRGEGIKIIDIFPGATDSDMWKVDQREKYGYKMMQPDDVAKAVIKVIELAMLDRLMVEEIVLRPQGGDL